MSTEATLSISGTGFFASDDAETNLQTLAVAAFAFLARPESFPVFQQWCISKAEPGDSYDRWLRMMTPGILQIVAEGFAADAVPS
jgi:hypothetical protein